MVARRFQASMYFGLILMTASSSLMARSMLCCSIAVCARVIRSIVVSLCEEAHSAQMCCSIALAVSSLGATLSAPNRKSRFCLVSPRSTGGNLAGGCTQSSGAAAAGAAKAAATVNSSAMNCLRMSGAKYLRRLKPICGNQEGRRSRCGSTLARLEAAVGLVDDVDPALATHDAVVAVAPAQGFQRIADFHDCLCCLTGKFIGSSQA